MEIDIQAGQESPKDKHKMPKFFGVGTVLIAAFGGSASAYIEWANSRLATTEEVREAAKQIASVDWDECKMTNPSIALQAKLSSGKLISHGDLKKADAAYWDCARAVVGERWKSYSDRAELTQVTEQKEALENPHCSQPAK
jgi:hypothetical protein